MIFNKTLTELKKALSPDIDEACFHDTGNNKVVLRMPNRAIMNWFTSTGTLQFQGPEFCAKELADFVTKRLSGDMSAEYGAKEAPQEKILMPMTTATQEEDYLFNGFDKTELFLAIVSPVGTPLTSVRESIKSNIERFGYKFIEIHLSSSLREDTSRIPPDEYTRISELMLLGDQRREKTGRNDIMAMAAISMIINERGKSENKEKKLAFFINSLKHPDEIHFLRKVYGSAFYLIGVHADKKRRTDELVGTKHCSPEQAEKLMTIDEDENIAHGQKTRETFHQADFFLNVANDRDLERNLIKRFFEIIFSNPHKAPLFDEFAMFMAFSCSVRSSDLSRQVGAVLAKNNQIIATGVNDCPQAGGGQYWAHINKNDIVDNPDGKDYMVGIDSNKQEQQKIIGKIFRQLIEQEIISEEQKDPVEGILANSGIKDLIEFGRVVHAEMETILSCARAGINTAGTTLYCTTFPCHNCAKHIIDAGITRVVYVEPYPKSKALELHNDSIELHSEDSNNTQKVQFEAFQGIAARRFLDLFSMSLGAGNKIKRKERDGRAIEWNEKKANLRIPKVYSSYKCLEDSALKKYNELLTAGGDRS